MFHFSPTLSRPAISPFFIYSGVKTVTVTVRERRRAVIHEN